jgi:hypothetical protein
MVGPMRLPVKFKALDVKVARHPEAGLILQEPRRKPRLKFRSVALKFRRSSAQ